MKNRYKRANRPYDIEDHKALVAHLARGIMTQYRIPPHIDIEDLVQEGMIGLLDAHENYNPKLNVPIAAYARQRIYGSIIDFLRAQSVLPRNMITETRKANKIIHDFVNSNNRKPTRHELAELCNMSLDEVENVLLAINYKQFNSNDRSKSVDGVDEVISGDLMDELYTSPVFDPECELGASEIAKKVFDGFDYNTKMAVSLFLFEGLSQEEIADILGITASRTSQLITKAKNLLTASLFNV